LVDLLSFGKKFYFHRTKSIVMQSTEKIVYYTELNEELKEPLAVIEEFCDWADKDTVKKQMWEWLMAAMGAQYAGYEEAGKRWELLFLYRRLEGLVEAVYGIGEEGEL
jgi:hypothetical protein